MDLFDFHPLKWWYFPYTCSDPKGTDVEIFTDGSKINGSVGSSVVVFYHGALIHSLEHRLSDFASVYQAEAHGLDLALTFVLTLQCWDAIRIYTDSLSLLQALSVVQS
ncbi:hypothetical protein AVEN_182881-1 [Araneus ventricosus]|uniref:Uncharacterized protein n=1 Tax=Araneus ventricosus TaxID=182803 RepID=A0A4Y2JEH0_ARAVE|nr:hypothetical protein AVEN_182881-1 [Araneus ventricosus]